MFTPLNKETSKKRLKSIVKERRALKETYYNFLLDIKKLDNIFSVKIDYEENYELLSRIKEYALYNCLLKNIDIDIKKYDIFRYKKVLFFYIKKTIENKEFIKAKKLLNICKERGYENNEYFDLLYKLKKFY